jgi:hypothetical protein
MFNIFEGKEDLIASKTPFIGKLPIDVSDFYDWEKHLNLLDTHPEKLLDPNTKKFRMGMNSFHERPSSPQFAKDIVAEMREFFSMHEKKITNIAFTGFGPNSDSYPWHADSMDVFFVQVLGDVEVTIEGLNDNKPQWFRPGDYGFFPRGCHHRIQPHKSRVSFSFGVEGDPDPSTYM